MNFEPRPTSALPSASRNPAVLIVGVATLTALWLPPLPWVLHAADFPQGLRSFLTTLRAIKPDETWLLRCDYFLFPPLFAYALWTTWKSRASLAECGLGRAHFLHAIQFLWLPTLAGVVILLGIGALNHNVDIALDPGCRFWKRLNPIPALFQQMAIQLFFHRQIMAWTGTGRKTAAFLTLFFVALHAPNPGLMLGTLSGMYFWARCYQRHPNLYALALSHALLSAVLMHTMPRWMLPSVSVGHRFVEKAAIWWGM